MKNYCNFTTWAFLDEKNHHFMLKMRELLLNADWKKEKNII